MLLSFLIWNLRSAVTSEYGRVVPSRKSVYFRIRKLILYFPNSFHVPCTVLFTVYFHAVLSMFCFLRYSLHSKTNAANQTIQLGFYWTPLVTQSNVPAVTAENEEQYILSYITYIKRRMLTNLPEETCYGVHFFDKIAGWGSATLPKMCSSTTIFQGFCSDL